MEELKREIEKMEYVDFIDEECIMIDDLSQGYEEEEKRVFEMLEKFEKVASDYCHSFEVEGKIIEVGYYSFED